jgi:glycosyltransferase involved in cell wall biosynthesis
LPLPRFGAIVGSGDDMKSILFVDSAEALGGAERSLLLLMEHLDPNHFHPILASNASPLAEEARAAGIEVAIVPMLRLRHLPTAPSLLVRGARGVARLIRMHDVAIVHANVMRASFYAAAAARWTGTPLVWHVRDIHTERWYIPLMCAFAARAIAISQAVAESIPCRAKLSVIHNGIDLAAFDPALDRDGVRRDLQLPSDVPVIGTVGRLRPWKRQDLFLQAASRVSAAQADVHYAVVGDTIFPAGHDYLGELRALALDLGIVERVVFPGYRSDMAQVMATLDVLVHTADAEPFGRVLIEAMAMGRPIVAFRDGGVPEIVADGETGILVEPGDVDGIANAVVGLLADPERRIRMGSAGRERAARLFGAATTARAVERVYDELLGDV